MAQHEWIYGHHAVAAIVSRQPERVIEVWLQQGHAEQAVEDILARLQPLGVNIQRVSRKVLDERTDGATHQGIMIKAKPGKSWTEQDLAPLLDNIEQPLLLLLDGVTDPHNIGACLRSADAAGVHAVIAPRDRSGGLTMTARKVASGAAEVVPFIPVTNLARTMRYLQQRGIWLVGTAGEAKQSIYQATFKGPLALVMGAEGSGMRRLTRETCDELVKIPMQGLVSSLNVSVATGVCLFEILRQKLG